MQGIKTTAFQSYQTGMRVYCGANAPYREPVQVKDKHLELKNEALEFYAETPRLDAVCTLLLLLLRHTNSYD